MALPPVLVEGPCHAIFYGCPPTLSRLPPATIYRFGCGSGPPVEAELCFGDPGVNGSLLRRVCRSVETLDLLEKRVQIHLLMHLIKSRIRARGMICNRAHPVDPGSGDCVFDEAKGATAVHLAGAGHLHKGHLFHQTVANAAYHSPSPPVPGGPLVDDLPPPPSRHLSSRDRITSVINSVGVLLCRLVRLLRWLCMPGKLDRSPL